MSFAIESIAQSRFGLMSGPRPEDPVFLGLVGDPSMIEPEMGFFSPSFFTTTQEASWFPIRDFFPVPKKDFVQFLESMNPKPFPGVYEVDHREKDRFLESVVELQNQFKSTTLRKVVPYARAHAQPAPSRENQLHMILSALQQQARTGGYLYALSSESGGMLGLTPELLFEKQLNQVHTMALAGTRMDEVGAEEKLLADRKELIEHEWVVEGIRESIQDLGAIELSLVRVRRSGRLLHLETKIKLESSALKFAQIVERLHPTPALGGYPKSDALNWLASYNEISPRSRFGAPFGFKYQENEICLVAIRGIEWSALDDACQMGAGCGITEMSHPEAEWGEVKNKWRSICHSLGQREFT